MSGARPPLRAKVELLRNPLTHGQRAGAVECIETHFAWVFLTPRFAYKLKKPLRHQLMDYRTLAARERACREELRLNRRLAPSIYRAVVPIRMRDGQLSLGGHGAVVEWLVKMRRLPDASMLDHALAGATSAEVNDADIRRIVARLGRFYRQARPWPFRPAAYLASLQEQVAANHRAISRYGRRLPQEMARHVCELQMKALRALRPALVVRSGHVVEGHGDLRAEHVYLGPPVAVIDSLEFDATLRRFDPAEEVALLALEIGRLGRPDLAQTLERHFATVCPGSPPPEVAAFYRSNRAATRAKLAAWHLADPQFPDAKPWIARTRSLLQDALAAARSALALAGIAPSAKVPDGRPALKQRRKGRAADHPRHRLRQEWRNVQQREARGA